jgi:predicted dithiol-disulfide oxidoreductase (DUF899 family)
MPAHKTGTCGEWLAARTDLLAAEKDHMRRGDAVARRRLAHLDLPWVPIGKEYLFETDDGQKTLAELCAGRSQLLVCHFMFGYGARSTSRTRGTEGAHLSPVISMPPVPHLNGHDVTLVAESIAPLDELRRYKQRMGTSSGWVGGSLGCHRSAATSSTALAMPSPTSSSKVAPRTTSPHRRSRAAGAWAERLRAR